MPRLPLLLLVSTAGCAGPGFQLEGSYSEIRPDQLDFHSSVPAETQELDGVLSRRSAVRIAVGGPEFSARGYLQLIGEELELPTAAGSGDFDNVGIGVGVLGRQQLTAGYADEPVVILPYRFGVNYFEGDGRGAATSTGRFGDIEYFEWEADLGLGVSIHTFDLVAGYALRSFDGTLQILDTGGVNHDGLRGLNSGPYLSGAWSFGDLPWRLEARVGFGDFEELRIGAGLHY
jgi:hypothetical protein